MKKVLVTYVSAGAGHKKAAEAVYEYLIKSRPDLEVRIIDILDYANPLFKTVYSKWYIFVVSKLPWLWYLFYCLSFFAPENPIRRIIEYSFSGPFVKLLKEERFDYLVSTHFLSNSIVSILKSEASLNIEAISVVTDYTLHPFWVSKAVDTYIVSCNEVKQELIKRGIEDKKIKVRGIPAGEKFYKTLERNIVAEKLGINPQEFTGLIITGAIGIGPIEEVVKSLSSDVQLVVVCGNNQRLYKRLLELDIKNLKVYPLVNNVDELMSSSDVILTKAGGLTITEALVKSLPLVFFASIPGLETANADVVCKYGAGFKTKTVRQIRDTILSLKNQPAIYKSIQERVKSLRKHDSLEKISGEILPINITVSCA